MVVETSVAVVALVEMIIMEEDVVVETLVVEVVSVFVCIWCVLSLTKVVCVCVYI